MSNYRSPIATIVLIHRTLSAVYLSNHYQANCAKNMSTNVSHLLIRSVCRKAAWVVKTTRSTHNAAQMKKNVRFVQHQTEITVIKGWLIKMKRVWIAIPQSTKNVSRNRKRYTWKCARKWNQAHRKDAIWARWCEESSHWFNLALCWYHLLILFSDRRSNSKGLHSRSRFWAYERLFGTVRHM